MAIKVISKLATETFLIPSEQQFIIMKESYHCLPCNKEFIDKELAKDHRKSTGHEVIERTLEK